MKIVCTRAAGVIGALLLCVPAVSFAQQPPRSQGPAPSSALPGPAIPSVDDIRERAARIAKYRDLLNDKDQSVREAAFTEVANSDDPALQEMAYEMAFASSEVSMRALALRTRLTHLVAFTFDVEITSGPEAALPATVTYRAFGSDEKRAVLFLSDHPIKIPTDVGGTLSATGLEVTVDIRGLQPHCWGRMRMDDAGALTGVLSCNPTGSNAVVTLKAKARLY
jgi:hypothetical protein